jgi:hypothetical protein
MSHDYHEGLPNFSPHQLFHDGCDECEQRASHQYAFAKVDLKAAWLRAYRWEKRQLSEAEQPISIAEAPHLRMIWTIQVLLERDGVPLGVYPGDLATIIRRELSPGALMQAAAAPLDALLADAIKLLADPTEP